MGVDGEHQLVHCAFEFHDGDGFGDQGSMALAEFIAKAMKCLRTLLNVASRPPSSGAVPVSRSRKSPMGTTTRFKKGGGERACQPRSC